ncbi:uncharacterized protein LOC131681639 [Topomyia yanbarensis]|uniref:uncharacterized protein LOC131681639 n=1 Tax=Topomyia yanbarensis TaxID=2498891 RepID=UPI00273C60A3|nr:uncharacterized protein LOC131681639 [Topomyia yanbarensis]XP_058818537.1 uncharacterized protein LOC131681639 [Topomyia yanbarensis]
MPANKKLAAIATVANEAEEPNAFVIWNRRIPVTDSRNRDAESFTNFSFVFEADSNDISSLSAGDIVPFNEIESIGPEKIVQSLEMSYISYNIIQNKMNLNEKRGPKFLCQECRSTMHTRLSMITHMKMHLKPFCEVCFGLFESTDAVRSHINTIHPEVVIQDRATTPTPKEYYYMQTIAPPNTPNPLSDDEMKTIEGLVNPIVKLPVIENSVNKLLSHEDTDEAFSTEDEHGLVIDERPPQPVGHRKRPIKKPPILKRQLKKKITKGKSTDASKPENVLKKITSRFGRAISLKLPQY